MALNNFSTIMAGAILWHFAEEQRRKKALKVSRRAMRDASNPFALPEREFVAQFRFTKEAFHGLCHEIVPLMQAPKRNTMIRQELKVLAALSFFARGSYQRSVATSFVHNMSQPALCNALEEVTNVLNSGLILAKYIQFPTQRERRERIMTDFMNMTGMPGTIGCIDGSHIAIIRPDVHEAAYYNRKGYHSLNVIVICDRYLNVMHVDASYGGAAHDSFIWGQGEVKTFMEQLNLNRERCWLLGDSGFAQRGYMMTPILRAAENSPEEHYTKLHCSTRNVVERCFGVLKARWRCLLAHRVLHYNPEKAGKIVNACVVLHNIANAHNVPIPQLTATDQRAIQRSQLSQELQDTADADVRDLLVQRLWAARS